MWVGVKPELGVRAEPWIWRTDCRRRPSDDRVRARLFSHWWKPSKAGIAKKGFDRRVWRAAPLLVNQSGVWPGGSLNLLSVPASPFQKLVLLQHKPSVVCFYTGHGGVAIPRKTQFRKSKASRLDHFNCGFGASERCDVRISTCNSRMIELRTGAQKFKGRDTSILLVVWGQ